MKFLLFTPVSYSIGRYELHEFATKQALEDHIRENGLAAAAVLCQRLDIQVGEYPELIHVKLDVSTVFSSKDAAPQEDF